MAGEFIAAQLPTRPVSATNLASTTTPSATQTFFTSYHTIAAGATGNADDVLLFNANMPTSASVAIAILIATAGAGGASAYLTDAAGGGGNHLTMADHPATGAMRSARTGNVSWHIHRGGSLWLRRTNDNIGGTMLVFWFPYAEAGAVGELKSGQLPATFATAAVLADAPAATYGVPFCSTHACAVGGGGADDVQIFNAAFPRKALLLYSFYMSTVTKAGTLTIRSVAGGVGGDVISADLDTNTATVVGSTGTGTALASGASAYARRTDGTSSGTLFCVWLPQA